MPNEDFIHHGYMHNDGVRGEKFGNYELFNLGNTTAKELKRLDLIETIDKTQDIVFKQFKKPKDLGNSKPDTLIYEKSKGKRLLKAIVEYKQPKEFSGACQYSV